MGMHLLMNLRDLTVLYSYSSDIWLRIKTQTAPSPESFRQQTCRDRVSILGLFYKCSINRSLLKVYYLALMANLGIWYIISAGHNG